MNIDELKKAMLNSPVAFKYVKNDGTIREAYGTLNKSLIPQTPTAIKYQITDISWVNADSTTTFPSSLQIPVSEAQLSAAENETAYDFVADYLTENYGPHNGFQMHEIKKPAPNPDICKYYDLLEGHVGWKQFHISKLIG